MVWSLEEIKDVEDLQLLSGHIYMILGNLEKAQVRCIATQSKHLLIHFLNIFVNIGLLFEIVST